MNRAVKKLIEELLTEFYGERYCGRCEDYHGLMDSDKEYLEQATSQILKLISDEVIKALINALQEFKVPEQWKEFFELSGYEACPICGFNSEYARKYVDDKIKALEKQ